MSWTLARRDGSAEPTTVASGEDEREGYVQLWAHQALAVEQELENDGRGMMWPVGRRLSATYTLSFGEGMDIDLAQVWPTDLLVLQWWVYGKGKQPNRGRLEQIARLHMDLRDGAQALKKLALDYTRTLQAAE